MAALSIGETPVDRARDGWGFVLEPGLASVWGGDVPTPEEYQQKAVECLRLAQVTNDPTNKALLLEMAQAWINLADQVKARGDQS